MGGLRGANAPGEYGSEYARRIRQENTLGEYAKRIRQANMPGEYAWRIRQANTPGEYASEYVSECASEDASASVGLGQANPTNRGSKNLHYEDDAKTIGFDKKKPPAIRSTNLIEHGAKTD